MKKKKIAAVILAAGRGTRMKSRRSKVLHSVLGQPMINYCLGTVSPSKLIDEVFVVARDKRDVLKFHLDKNIRTVLQKKARGTADAVRCALPATQGFEHILVAYGDTPLLFRSDTTLKRLIQYHLSKNGTACTLLSAVLPRSLHYGRIIRDRKRKIMGVAEEMSCSKEERKIKEINAGLYCFRRKDLISALREVTPSPPQGEYYLTDTIAILSRKGKKIESVTARNPSEALGINSPRELRAVEAILKKRGKR